MNHKPMNAEEYRRSLAAVGLIESDVPPPRHHGAALLLGIDSRTSQKWWYGERAVSGPAAAFLRYLIATGTSAEQAMRILGLD
jgi:hypothetical protein